MNAHVRKTIQGGILAFLYGCLLSIATAAVVFLVGYLVGGMSFGRGYEWARRAVYVVGAVGIIIGGTSLFTAGGKTREEQLDPNNYMVPESFRHVPGVSWPVALVWGGVGFFVTGTLFELAFNTLL